MSETTQLSDADEVRLVKDLADALRDNDTTGTWELHAAKSINDLISKGYVITPPPAPEPVYVLRMTEAMKSRAKSALTDRYYSVAMGWSDEDAFELYRLLVDLTPEER